MSRRTVSLPLLALSVFLMLPAGAPAAPSPVPSHPPHKQTSPFANAGRSGRGQSPNLSSAACNRRTVGMTSPRGGTMGPNGPSQSQTLIAVPLGGRGSVSSRTAQQQISEACAHQRH